MFSLSVPSKTFLIGEYSALNGGPALMLATSPRFQLKASLCLGSTCQRVGFDGPSMSLLSDKAFDEYELQFVDPHQGRGGLGASSAQFVLLHAFYNWLKFQPTKADRLLAAYRNVVRSQSEILPSGYDVLAQFRGHLSYIHWKKSEFDLIAWPFEDLDVFLIRGPMKVQTHEHLKNLKLDSTIEFETLAFRAFESLRSAKSQDFISSINDVAKLLKSKNLTLKESIELQDVLRKNRSVKAAKGCGALGADVVAAVVPLQDAAEFTQFLENQKLELISRLSQTSPGLRVDEMSHGELQSKYESEVAYFREEVSAHDMVR